MRKIYRWLVDLAHDVDELHAQVHPNRYVRPTR